MFLLVTRTFKKKYNPLESLIVNIDTVLIDVGTDIDVKFGNGSIPSEQEVLQSIQKAFDIKKLKEVDNIETPLEQYLENPNEVSFFNNLIRAFCNQVRMIVSHSFKKHYVQE